MPSRNELLDTTITEAAGAGNLLAAAAQNIATLLGGASSTFYEKVVAELAGKKEWAELNDRFFRTLAFGTGGLRGRTIGKVVAEAERGGAKDDQPPEFPCVGTNAMNFYNVSRATQGLVAYLQEWRAQQKIEGKPKLVIACDTRHYSKQF
ncbi:MAG: phosphoglucomutase, partial [Verrucomicrobiota bacterium]